MAVVQNSWTGDFLLYQREPHPLDMAHLPPSDAFGAYGFDDGAAAMGMGAYDELTPGSAAGLYGTPSFVFDEAKDASSDAAGTSTVVGTSGAGAGAMPPHHYTPSDSPSTSMGHTFEPAGSTYSHPSAASSAMGSPYPAAAASNGSIPAPDSWMDATGLGINAADYAAATGADPAFASFVGESRSAVTGPRARDDAPSTSSMSSSSTPHPPTLVTGPLAATASPLLASPPFSAVSSHSHVSSSPTAPGGVSSASSPHPPPPPTIDTIIEEANRRSASASRHNSPVASAIPRHVSPGATRRAGASRSLFKAPPASATAAYFPRPQSPYARPPLVRRTSAPQPVAPGALVPSSPGAHAPPMCSPSSYAPPAPVAGSLSSYAPSQATGTPAFFPPPPPAPSAHPPYPSMPGSSSYPPLHHHHLPPQPSSAYPTPFFNQSSGRFVPPLESSCSFPSCLSFVSSGDPSVSTSGWSNVLMHPDPTLIAPFSDPSMAMAAPNAPLGTLFTPGSPVPSNASTESHHGIGPISRHRSPAGMPYHPYGGRRPSAASIWSHAGPYPSPGSPFYELDHKGLCSECGRIFKDLKAHMLTHQSERPEKCPIPTCEYHTKGFARKYDRCRHTLTHYKGTMVCDFCPGGGSPAEKSFNRADVFKRHLTSVHGVEQNPPSSRRKSGAAAAAASRKGSASSKEAAPTNATGKCSTCSAIFNTAQDLYDHLDDCVLKSLEQAEPSEAINAQHLTAVAGDSDVRATLERHLLPVELETTTSTSIAEEDEEDEESAEEADKATASGGRSGPA